MREKAPPIHEFLAECTPGYLNNEGNVDDSALRLTIYGGGSIEYANLLKAWRDGDGVERDLALAGVREPAGERDRPCNIPAWVRPGRRSRASASDAWVSAAWPTGP